MKTPQITSPITPEMEIHIKNLIQAGQFTSQREYIRTLIREDMNIRPGYQFSENDIKKIRASLAKSRKQFDEGKGLTLEQVEASTQKHLEDLRSELRE